MANASECATGDMPAAAADVVRQDLPATAGTGAHEAVFQCELTSARSRPRGGHPAVRSEASTPRTTIMLEGTSIMDLTQSKPPRTSRGCGQRPPAGALRSSEHAFDAIRSGAWLTRGTRGHGLADTPEAPQAGGAPEAGGPPLPLCQSARATSWRILLAPWTVWFEAWIRWTASMRFSSRRPRAHVGGGFVARPPGDAKNTHPIPLSRRQQASTWHRSRASPVNAIMTSWGGRARERRIPADAGLRGNGPVRVRSRAPFVGVPSEERSPRGRGEL